ncbi:MAG: DUF4136 domain-containing protein [Polyangiaceae bacterium]
MRAIALALLGGLATACYPDGSGPPIQTAVSAVAQMPPYDTFSLGWTASPPAGYEASPRTLEVDGRLRELVRSALRQKGYVEDDDHPSFLVRPGAGLKPVKQDQEAEADARGARPRDTLRFEGINVIIYDAATKIEVWQGSARALIDLTDEIDNSLLHREVQDALAAFPPRHITAAYPFRG